jgi:hypothetical protein
LARPLHFTAKRGMSKRQHAPGAPEYMNSILVEIELVGATDIEKTSVVYGQYVDYLKEFQGRRRSFFSPVNT